MSLPAASARLWLEPLGLLLGAAAAGLAFKVLVLGRLRALLGRASTKLQDEALAVLGRHLPLWFVLAGLSAAAETSPLEPDHRALVHKAVVTGLWLSLTFAASRFLSGTVRVYAARFSAAAATTSLTENLVRIAVVGMGAMLILSNLGISIAPILTALGVGSLAVALALQTPLGNLFAGIQLVTADVVRVGHYVKLDTGQEGFVADVGWSATRLKDLSGNLITVPNAKLVQAVITNFSEPREELAVAVPVLVSYASDLAGVESATLETAREVQKTVAGAVGDFEPVVRFGSFADSGVQLSVILKARAFADRFLLTHEFLKRLHAAYLRKGIEIPLPQRVVHTRP